MKASELQKIIKEEINKVLKEINWYKAQKEFERDDTKYDYPIGGEDEREFVEMRDLDYKLRYGFDFPPEHRFHGKDFLYDDQFEESWEVGRANVLGDEFARKSASAEIIEKTK